MSAFFPRRFSSPESVKRISPKNLLALLAPSREYLAGRGLVLPQEANDPVDYETLVAILVDPSPDMPKSLIDGLYFVHEMSTPECMADLLEAAAPGVLDFEEGEEPTPADVAVHGDGDRLCLPAPGRRRPEERRPQGQSENASYFPLPLLLRGRMSRTSRSSSSVSRQSALRQHRGDDDRACTAPMRYSLTTFDNSMMLPMT